MRFILVSAFSLFLLLLSISCKTELKKENTLERIVPNNKIVLAQWSFNRELFKGEMNTFDFVRVAKEMGFVGVEFVNQFFKDEVENKKFLDSLRMTSEKLGIKNTLLMIDGAGELGASNNEERESAVAQHKKWMVAAKWLGCPNIRVNAHGDGSSEEVFTACKTSIAELLKYGKEQGVGVLIENHGSFSSDGDWIFKLVEELKPMGVASLADFDNWCIERENGELWGAPCIKEYDRYIGVQKLLPTAKSISIKAFDFDDKGMPIKTDFERMFKLIHESGYQGYLAVEFEGHTIDAKVGVLKLKGLIEKLHKGI